MTASKDVCYCHCMYCFVRESYGPVRPVHGRQHVRRPASCATALIWQPSRSWVMALAMTRVTCLDVCGQKPAIIGNFLLMPALFGPR